MIVEKFQLSFHVFVCAFRLEISSFFRKSFPFLFSFFVVSLLRHLAFHMLVSSILNNNDINQMTHRHLELADQFQPSITEKYKSRDIVTIVTKRAQITGMELLSLNGQDQWRDYLRSILCHVGRTKCIGGLAQDVAQYRNLKPHLCPAPAN